MQPVLEHHNIRITALSPIHVGDGKKIGKKEYIQLKGVRGPVIIPDFFKMIQTLDKHRLVSAYEKFILRGSNKGLGEWLLENHISIEEIEKWTRYTMNPGDAFEKEGRKLSCKDIMTFIKDSYNKPYIPGSTLKGMLRTAVLCYRIYQNSKTFEAAIRRLASASNYRKSGKYFLKDEMQNLEAEVFNTLNCQEKSRDAVNSIMSGFIVSDSVSIEENQLILAQKFDYSLQGSVKGLPILREALKPGTQIDYEITIDKTKCNITIDEIVEALNFFNKKSYEYFYSRFNRGNRDNGIVWLGGGTGFLSKTMLYPVFGKEALGIVDKIFKATLSENYNRHNHNKDMAYGVSPHCCKCTKYNGKLYDMGMGRIEVLD